jgi:hypothetical protein
VTSRLTDPLLRRFDLRSTAVVAIAVLLVAVPAFAVLKTQTTPHYAISKAQVERLARSDPRVQQVLRGHEVTAVKVTPLDDREQRVSFFGGSRTLADAAVAPHRVTQVSDHADSSFESGSSIVNFAPMLLALTLVFVLALATVPLVSVRNLDVLAMASFTSSIILLNGSYVLQGVCVAYPPLAYLAFRCMSVGLGGWGWGAGGESLLWHLTRTWPLGQRTRVLKLVVLTAAAVAAMVIPSSTGSTDVNFAAMSGATDLLHGISPYGHIPNFIFHGDTYPLLTYVLYIPGALAMPVYDSFSDPTGGLLVTATVMLLAAFGLYRIGRRMAESREDTGPDPEAPRFAGMRLALAWLTFPPALLAASGGSNDIVVAGCLVAAFAVFERAALSTFLLGVASWVKVLPALAIPLWLARLAGRRAIAALAAIGAVSLVLCGWLVALGGFGAVRAMLHGLGFQAERGSLHSVWLGLGLQSLQPISTALLLTGIVTATLVVRRDAAIRDDAGRMTALFAGIMLLAQIAANYWTWAYLPWVLVPMLLSLFAPGREGTATYRPSLAVQERAQVPVNELVTR